MVNNMQYSTVEPRLSGLVNFYLEMGVSLKCTSAINRCYMGDIHLFIFCACADDRPTTCTKFAVLFIN